MLLPKLFQDSSFSLAILDSVHISFLTHACHTPCQQFSLSSDNTNNISGDQNIVQLPLYNHEGI
jgi:hypothetical protein